MSYVVVRPYTSKRSHSTYHADVDFGFADPALDPVNDSLWRESVDVSGCDHLESALAIMPAVILLVQNRATNTGMHGSVTNKAFLMRNV